MKNMLLCIIVGAIVAQIWGTISWMVLPWHNLDFKQFKNDNTKVFNVSSVLGFDETASVVNYIATLKLGKKNYMGEAVYGNNNVAEYNIIFFTNEKKYVRERNYLSSLQKNIVVKDKDLSYVFDIKQEMLLRDGRLETEDIQQELDYAKSMFKFREASPDNISITKTASKINKSHWCDPFASHLHLFHCIHL